MSKENPFETNKSIASIRLFWNNLDICIIWFDLIAFWLIVVHHYILLMIFFVDSLGSLLFHLFYDFVSISKFFVDKIRLYSEWSFLIYFRWRVSQGGRISRLLRFGAWLLHLEKSIVDGEFFVFGRLWNDVGVFWRIVYGLCRLLLRLISNDIRKVPNTPVSFLHFLL